MGSGLDVDMSEVTSCEKGKSSSEVKNDDESITAAEIPSKMKKKKKRKVKDRDEDVLATGTENTEEVSEKKKKKKKKKKISESEVEDHFFYISRIDYQKEEEKQEERLR